MARAPRVIVDKDTQKRSNEHLKKREEEMPIYQSQEFKPPKTMTKAEKAVWRWLVGIFRSTVNCRVSDADVHLMELYCRAKVSSDEADAALKDDPRPYILVETGTVETKDKDESTVVEKKVQVKSNPNIKKRADNAALCIKLFDQLGLSPLARARAGLKSANAIADKDPFKDLLNRSDD